MVLRHGDGRTNQAVGRRTPRPRPASRGTSVGAAARRAVVRLPCAGLSPMKSRHKVSSPAAADVFIQLCNETSVRHRLRPVCPNWSPTQPCKTEFHCKAHRCQLSANGKRVTTALLTAYAADVSKLAAMA